MNYKNYTIEPDNTGYAPKNMTFLIFNEEEYIGSGETFEECKKLIDENILENLKDLKKKLEKVEKELDKVRGKEYEQPFGSMRRAKISRKWDELAKTKSILQTLIYDLEKCEKCRSFDTENCHSINCPKR